MIHLFPHFGQYLFFDSGYLYLGYSQKSGDLRLRLILKVAHSYNTAFLFLQLPQQLLQCQLVNRLLTFILAAHQLIDQIDGISVILINGQTLR